MANGFVLDSEQLQQSPQQQQLAAQQPTPAQGQGKNLLSFLGDLGMGLLQGIEQAGASYAATQGRPQMLQQLEARKQQQQMAQQFKNLSPEDLQGPLGETLQRQLQFGDMQGAQKTLINMPKYRQAQELFKNPKLGLEPSELESLQLFSTVDPEGALKLGRRMVELGQVTKRQRESQAARLAKEERAEARKEARRPGPIVAKALQEGTVNADDPASILGLLTAEGVSMPRNENEARLFVSRIMEAPEIKKLIPKKEEKGFFDRLFNMFSPKQAPATTIPTPATVAPVRKYNPATGRVE